MALDWFSGLVGYDASALRVGQVFSVDPGGEIAWSRDRWETVEGSFRASIQVTRVVATAAMRDSGYLCSPVALRVSGNPSKFLQGHNVFGPSVEDAGPVIQGMVRAFPDGVRPPDAAAALLPAVHRSRYDVALHVDLADHRVVHEWLRAAGSNTRSRHGRAIMSGDTVYWGKSSRRWSFKAYCKFCELKDHPPKVDDPELRSWCETHVRLELTLRRPELKDREGLTEDVVWEYWEKLTIGSVNMSAGSGPIPEIDGSTACRMLLEIWARAGDPRLSAPRRTFYRYRRQILDQVGVDISIPRDQQWAAMEGAGFDVAYLRSREVKDVPDVLQRRLFRVA